MKKDYGDIPKSLRKMYDEIEVPHEIFKVTNLDYKVRRRRMKFVTLFIIPTIVVIVLIAGGVLCTNLFSNNSNNIPNNIQANEDNVKYFNIDISKSHAKASKIKYLSIVKFERIEGHCIVNEIAYTKVRVSTIDNYKNVMPSEEYIYIPGGQFRANEIKDIVTEEIEENDIINLKYNTTMFLSDMVEGQEYVVGVDDVDGKLIVNTEFKYGFKKYNREDNTVENRENEYEEFLVEDYMLK